ncbi:uncharacterized protein Z518_10894 [Rhinocladiella mackenziei CBS 650.93]|uniref:Rhinocladiella mackenziei CBS 650.93 unplaced genomic scaffold supercont1.10, whole genome shotgun sequence n=1 Tax=Rhinocladiella mackenziei CBS 650.93 TaxID=1442369 RepID=A0A0D2FD07_9EURO|nr:uncharacterized protein Z518_10894 [Rhinocladiella mackenziei CBS 650.93]KIW99966.1 hypothetical protein Z518_10894 [Rhinocladiella mackenziei CBS 650.93]
MAFSNSRDILRLARDLSERDPLDAELKTHNERVISSLKYLGNYPDNGVMTISKIMPELAMYFHQVALRGRHHDPRLSVLLADTTREVPLWRPQFGLPSKPSSEENSQQVKGEVAPDCVLEVARRIIIGPWHETYREQIRSALRIIANCCADNNVNRSIIIHRGGIEAMMHLALYRRECDLLLPTLYNVCVDFDEPALDNERKPWPPLQLAFRGSEQNSGPAVNLAEQKLGMSWDTRHELSSVEILLETKTSADNCLGILADVVEMASRVALYGIHQLVRNLDDDDSVEKAEVYTIQLVHTLLNQGTELAKEDFECCASVCQAVLNVLSQQACYGAVLSADGALWQLIHLPYACVNDDEDEESHESLVPYRKAILKTTYEISTLEKYGAKFNGERNLIHNCIDLLKNYGEGKRDLLSVGPRPWASVCVLLANKITSADRAISFVKSTHIASVISRLISQCTDSDILLPAIDLATRLALCTEGQDALHVAGMMSSLCKLLTPTSEANAMGINIQRETVTLMRLLIKGRAEHISDLKNVNGEGADNQRDSIVAAMMYLFQNTNDSRTKTEIGRFSIEVLRTLFASAPSQPAGLGSSTNGQPSSDLPADKEQQPESESQAIEAQFLSIFNQSPATSKDGDSSTVADTIAYIVTQPAPRPHSPSPDQAPAQSIQTEAEAWFGLGLLSTLSVARPWILAALSRDDNRLLSRLREIISQSQSSSSLALSSTSASGAGSVNQDQVPNVPADTKTFLPASKDPRYENVKVFVVKMMHAPPINDTSTNSSSRDKTLQESLEAVAAEMGVDWVLV